MFAALILAPERCPPRLGEGVVQGLPCRTLTASVPRTAWGRRRLSRALEQLYRAGVRQVLMGTFPLTAAELAAHGLTGVDPAPLRQAALGPLLICLARMYQIPLESACVRLSAPGSTPAVWTAAEIIVRTGRYLVPQTGRGQAALEEALRCRWGVAPGGIPQLEVCFAAKPCGDVPAVLVGEGCRCQRIDWRTAAGEILPEETAAALWAAQKRSIGYFVPVWVEPRT